MNLFNYFRSSSSYRVRIACNLKGLPYEYVAVHLNRNGGEQFAQPFSALNPPQLVPMLEDGEFRIGQSIAILEYLEERYPEVPLIPRGEMARAKVRQIAQYVACEMHPLNNLRVLKFLSGPLGLSEDQKQRWIVHWLETGLAALEVGLSQSPDRGAFSFGNTPTLADCCLVPQLFNARRFGVDVQTYPTLHAIERRCEALDAFKRAHPSCQPDSE